MGLPCRKQHRTWIFQLFCGFTVLSFSLIFVLSFKDTRGKSKLIRKEAQKNKGRFQSSKVHSKLGFLTFLKYTDFQFKKESVNESHVYKHLYQLVIGKKWLWFSVMCIFDGKPGFVVVTYLWTGPTSFCSDA